MDAALEFVAVRGVEGMQGLLDRNPELSTPAVDDAFTTILRSIEKRGDTAMHRFAEARYSVLLQRRTLIALEKLEVGALGAVADAIEAANKLVSCSVIAAGDGDFSAGALALAGGVFLDAFDILHDASYLSRASILLHTALGRTSEDSYTRSTVLRELFRTHVSLYELANNKSDLAAAVDAARQAAVRDNSTGERHARDLTNLSYVLFLRHRLFLDPADLGAAIDAAEEGLEQFTTDLDNRRVCLANLATATLARYLRSGVIRDLDRATTWARESVIPGQRTHPRLPFWFATLGRALSYEYDRAGDATVLVEARRVLDQALDMLSSRPAKRWEVRADRATLLLFEYRRSGSILTLEEASSELAGVLNEAGPEAPERHLLVSELGSALLEMHQRTGKPEYLRLALNAFREAVGRSPSAEVVEHGTHLANLAIALGLRANPSESTATSDGEIALLKEAARLTTGHKRGRPTVLKALGDAYYHRYETTSALADLEKALEAHLESVDLVGPDDPRYSVLQGDAAHDLYVLRRFPASSGSQGIGGRQRLRLACRSGNVVAPSGTLAAAKLWSRWSIEDGEYEEALEAGTAGLEAVQALTEAQVGAEHGLNWLADAQGLCELVAYASARLGDLDRAVIAIERGRATLGGDLRKSWAALEDLSREGAAGLADEYRAAAKDVSDNAVRVADTPEAWAKVREAASVLDRAATAIRAVPGHEDFMLPASDDELRASLALVSRSRPIVYLVTAPPGGLALIVDGRPDRATPLIRAIDVPGLGAAEVGERVLRYLLAYELRSSTSTAWDAWLAELDRICSWLGLLGIGALFDDAQPDGNGIAIVPSGLLGLLPLHATWSRTENDGAVSRYAVDEAPVIYLPSARIAADSIRRGEPPPEKLAIVDEPKPVSAPDLPGSRLETDTVASYFQADNVELFRGEEAVRSRVLDAMERANVVHFSCHGRANLTDPLASGLLMSGDEKISVRDLWRRRLPCCRLAVLSACETGVAGVRAPDEIVSLAGALLQAGAGGAISSIWSVDATATLLLLSHFYELWRDEAGYVSPPDALRQSQLWLRALTRDERQRSFPDVDFSHSGDPGPTPYARPYWWAGFEYAGI